jgi:hypothetical protein
MNEALELECSSNRYSRMDDEEEVVADTKEDDGTDVIYDVWKKNCGMLLILFVPYSTTMQCNGQASQGRRWPYLWIRASSSFPLPQCSNRLPLVRLYFPLYSASVRRRGLKERNGFLARGALRHVFYVRNGVILLTISHSKPLIRFELCSVSRKKRLGL